MNTTIPSILNIGILGMSCGHCVAKVTKALSAVAGVEVKSVTVGSALISVTNPDATDAALAAIHMAGYTVRDLQPAQAQAKIGGCCGGSDRSSSCCG